MGETKLDKLNRSADSAVDNLDQYESLMDTLNRPLTVIGLLMIAVSVGALVAPEDYRLHGMGGGVALVGLFYAFMNAGLYGVNARYEDAEDAYEKEWDAQNPAQPLLSK